MRKIFLAFTILIILCSCSVGAENEDIYRKLESLERQIEYLQKNINDLSLQLDKSDVNNLVQYHKLSEKISSSHDFVFYFGLAINLLFLGLPFLFMCIESCRESRMSRKLIKFLHEKLK